MFSYTIETSVSNLVGRLDASGIASSIKEVERGLRRIELLFSREPQLKGMVSELKLAI